MNNKNITIKSIKKSFNVIFLSLPVISLLISNFAVLALNKLNFLMIPTLMFATISFGSILYLFVLNNKKYKNNFDLSLNVLAAASLTISVYNGAMPFGFIGLPIAIIAILASIKPLVLLLNIVTAILTYLKNRGKNIHIKLLNKIVTYSNIFLCFMRSPSIVAMGCFKLLAFFYPTSHAIIIPSLISGAILGLISAYAIVKKLRLFKINLKLGE